MNNVIKKNNLFSFEEFTSKTRDRLNDDFGYEFTPFIFGQSNGDFIVLVGNKGNKENPLIHLESYFDCYLNSGNFQEVYEEMVDYFKNFGEGTNVLSGIDLFNYNEMKDRLFVKALSEDYAQKKEAYNLTFHVSDMALQPNILISDDFKFGNDISIAVSEFLLKQWNVDFETLLFDSFKNGKELFPTVITDFGELLFKRGEIDEEAYASDMMYMVTNPAQKYGASTMFYDNFFEKLSGICSDKNFILIPASIHEVLLVPYESFLPNEINVPDQSITMIKDAVMQINRKDVKEGERLSDNIYYVDMKAKKLSCIELEAV